MNCSSTNYVCLTKYLAWVSVYSCQESALLGKEFRAGFRRKSAANIFFWHPWELSQFGVFYKAKKSPKCSLLKQCCSFLGKAGSEEQKTCTSTLAWPFPSLPMLYRALLPCGHPLCLSWELCFPTGQHCHSSCGCSVLWPKLRLLPSRNSILPLGEVSHGWLLHVSCICRGRFQTCPAWLLIAFLLFGNHLSRGSALAPHISAPGQETTSAQSCHPAHF